MSGVPILKKKLRGIRATEKLSKALKTVAMAKMARLNALRKNFSAYAEQYRFLYENQAAENTDLPDCVIVLAGNRGFCGAFNTDVVNFAVRQLDSAKQPVHLIACGQQAVRRLTEQKKTPDASYVFGDIPSFGECESLFETLEKRLRGQKNARVAVIYPAYQNTMKQTPEMRILSLDIPVELSDNVLWLPDRETVLDQILIRGFRTLLFGMILETALGVQAATLMTMRSAYDTATEYAAVLEREIGRKRQSEVTADVIETSVDHSSKGEGENG